MGSHPLHGGTITLVKQRRIARDASGRVYQERWLLVPKNGNHESQMSALQISDPNRHVLFTCMLLDGQHVCHETLYAPSTSTVVKFEGPPTGPLPNDAGDAVHEELGKQQIAGMETVGTRASTTYNPGVFGNDSAIPVEREYWFSQQLGINLLNPSIRASAPRRLPSTRSAFPNPKLNCSIFPKALRSSIIEARLRERATKASRLSGANTQGTRRALPSRQSRFSARLECSRAAFCFSRCGPNREPGEECTRAGDSNCRNGNPRGRIRRSQGAFRASGTPRRPLAEINAGIGISELQLGHYEASRQREARVLELVSKDHERAEAHNLIGTAWLRESAPGATNLKMLHVAEESFQRAIQQDPVFDTAHFTLGNALLRQGR